MLGRHYTPSHIQKQQVRIDYPLVELAPDLCQQTSEPSVNAWNVFGQNEGVAANCSAGSREMQCVPLYGRKVVGEGFIEMFFSPTAESHSCFLEEELAQ